MFPIDVFSTSGGYSEGLDAFRFSFKLDKRPVAIQREMPGKVCSLKKNQSTPRPSEHPPVMGGKMSKR